MPLARIFTRSSEDVAALAALVRELGYDTERASFDGNDQLCAADLEIEVERCATADALRRGAALAADIGADLFIAPGALACDPQPAAEGPPVTEFAKVSAPAAEAPPVAATI